MRNVLCITCVVFQQLIRDLRSVSFEVPAYWTRTVLVDQNTHCLSAVIAAAAYSTAQCQLNT